MIAFHLVISAYGFWLPNDPRGSWSDFVGSWELYKFGPATKVNDSRNYAKDPHDVELRRAAKLAIKYPPVRFNESQRIAIVTGFGQACLEGKYGCLACCVGYDHAHLVFSRHERPITMIAGHLKTRATRELNACGVNPLSADVAGHDNSPSPWSEGCWKVFIDDDEQLNAAMRYVKGHASKEGLPEQTWDLLRPLFPVSRRA